MSETKSMRVVPSGKIYKQMFEAQVQLNRSLTKIPRETTTLKTTKGGTSIPIVRLTKGDVEHGLLIDRQRTWAEGFPNDPYVENPVVYKQYAEFVGSQMKEPEASIEGREVRGLPDAVAPAKEGSNIIERIAASRKERHEAAVEEMHQELSVINSEMEPRIAESCEALLNKLGEDDKEIAAIFVRFENDDDLLCYPLEGLQEMWTEIQSHSGVRQGWIMELDTTLKASEDDRMDMIRSVFKDYAKNLEKIAHILSPDLHRFMDKESQLINQTVLSNRRAYGDLFVRLMSMDIEREKSQHAAWKRRVEDWKMLKTELSLKRFKVFMKDDKIVVPPGVQKLQNYMVKEQQLLNAKRMDLVNQLRDLEPPSSTKTSVYHWNKGVEDISKEIDTTNQLHLASLHREYENVCQNCLEEVDAIKREMVDTGVCTESRAQTVVEEFMIPIVGDRQRIYESNLETMEKNLEQHNKKTTDDLKSLFKYAQGAAHVWDVHEIGLARQERALQEKLEQCRQKHDNQNQEKEAHLDIIMDRMRQDATEKALKDSLTKALEMMEKIRHAYEIFHMDQTDIVQKYPEMVKDELKNYDEALCKLFMVDRNNPLDGEAEESAEDGLDGEPKDEDGQKSKTKPSLKASVKHPAPTKGPVRFAPETDQTPSRTKQFDGHSKDRPVQQLEKEKASEVDLPVEESDEKEGLDSENAVEEHVEEQNVNDDTQADGKDAETGDIFNTEESDAEKAPDDAAEIDGSLEIKEYVREDAGEDYLQNKDEDANETEQVDEQTALNDVATMEDDSIAGGIDKVDGTTSQNDLDADTDVKEDITITADADSDRTGSELSVVMEENEREDGDDEEMLDVKLKKKPPPPKKTLNKEATDLPSAVSDVLSTSKGTTFYILTVAGIYGIPSDKSRTTGKGADKSMDVTSAFMTEVSGVSGDGKPNYLSSIDVPESALIEIKKLIRLNFLNHLEDWTEQASERAQSVVVAKCEELNSELDLRLHLHKPRPRRAEYDVHNVRAAELVMHSERVTRHCKGIQQALTEVRNRFTSMTNEHNSLAAKFRQEIEALEVVFINATKASKLYSLKNQLNVELEKFMLVIRASLRQFRQHLDETVQMLRESNARFIKSFKVFSDGGNFCPEEIDVYRKRLDKMANSIDQAEGSVMSDLEDMESKRLEQATKVAIEFEDRFKSHMLDLIFMEKIARWLTNTQVKIKAEVANSNTHAQKLGQHLHDIERRIDACEKPNLDKEQITSSQLNDSLKAVFEAYQSRSVYLNCLKDPSMRPPSGTMQGPPAVGARVGFVQDLGPTPISKAGKQPSEDPSVGVIKTIMKSNKSKLRFGMDAEFDGEYTPNADNRDKMKSSMSTNTSSDRGKINHSRHGPSPSTTDINVRKTQSSAIRRTSKPTKFEKKTVIFGENTEDEVNANHFLGIIRRILKEALDGLLSSSEMYYRQKGTRLVTRPQALQETYDQCADVIIQKLQSYYQQADEYHNQCLQEFRSQLTLLEKSVARIPYLVVSDLVKEQITLSQAARADFQAQFKHTQADLQKKQEEHKHQLRPGLGHPHLSIQLTALCQKETDRHTEYIAAVEQHAKTLQNSAVEHATKYVGSLAMMSENQLLQYDNMLVVDDVEKGRVDAKKYPTTELIRRKNAGEPLEDDEDKDALPRGKNAWTGLPNNEMVCGDKPAKTQFTASVTTAKTSLGHSATVKARDQVFEDYKKQFENTLQQIEDEKQRLLLAEQRWMDSWNQSVEKVKMLY